MTSGSSSGGSSFVILLGGGMHAVHPPRLSGTALLWRGWALSTWRAPVVLATLLMALAAAGCVRQRCYESRDCPSSQICTGGACITPECDEDRPCGAGLECVANRCRPVPVVPITCPEDMVSVAGFYCADKYEASRPDASATSAGKDGSRAVSVAGVIPWQVADNATAERACDAAGKRMCTEDEWLLACKGPDGTEYCYGDSYQPATCNGIDTFGRQGFQLMPTGAFSACTNEWGLFDINGNLWEHVAGGTGMTVRGGAFNCNDSAALHRCDYVPGNWTPSALGFRCCLTPTGQPEGRDAGFADAGEDVVAEGRPETTPAAGEGGGGCVDDGGGRQRDDAPAVAEPSNRPDAKERGAEAAEGDVPGGDAPASGDDGGVSGVEAGADGEGPACPPEMAQVGQTCVDRYEASRPDATATSAGSDESVARSRAGVLPWYVNPMSTAAFAKFQAACAAAGKRLCEAAEWIEACQGPEKTTYVFGNVWDAAICNSVDTYCHECCDILGLTGPDCQTGENCGYSSSLTSSYTPETCTITLPYGKDTCHVCYHVMPTGAFPKCTNANGLLDVNGNVWEVVPVPTSEDSRGFQVRGGAFNCGSPSARFQCDFNATWNDLYAGFRCCMDRGG